MDEMEKQNCIGVKKSRYTNFLLHIKHKKTNKHKDGLKIFFTFVD